MKLYATTTSERATKGQGGNHLEITIQGGEYRDILARIMIECGDGKQLPFYTKIIDGDYNFLVNLKSNIAFYLDNLKVNKCIECNKVLPEEYTGYCYQCNEKI